MKRALRYGAASIVPLLLAAGCVMSPATGPVETSSESRPSPTLAPAVFFEEGKLIFLAVNTHIARFQLDAELIPLEIAVANKRLEQLRLSPEHITLRSLDGQRWPVASREESTGSSLRSSFDRKTMPVPFIDLVKQRLSNYRYVPSTSALRGGNIDISRTAELRRNTWTISQIWFPNPGGELKDQLFEVWVDSPELPDPVFTTIRF